MQAYPDHLPVIIGVGQAVDHWTGDKPDTAPDPVSMMAAATQRALADTGQAKATAKMIDVICALRTSDDSLPMVRFPFKMCKNIPRAVAAQTGLSPSRAIYSAVGGEQPQALVNEWARALYQGDAKAVLITGGEAVSAMKLALKNGHQLDWPYETQGEMEDRGSMADFVTPYELRNGVGLPPRTYALLEKAYRKRLGLSVGAYRNMASKLLSKLSKVAAENPYAQFPEEKSAEFLATESAQNFKINDVYLKWHMAQETVNQGAALILTTAGQAKEMDIDPAKMIFIHGHALLKDRMVSERPDISRSEGLHRTLMQALDASGLTPSDIDYFEIYSCFPVLVFLAAEYLGVDWRETQLTQTGGLPFFGGPGNNYSAHGIASLVERLRVAPHASGLVLANGGFISKFAAAVYSAQPPQKWEPAHMSELQAGLDRQLAPDLLEESCEAVIQSYVVSHSRGEPNHAFIMAETENGRILAQVKRGDDSLLAALDQPIDRIGQTVKITHENGQNWVSGLGF